MRRATSIAFRALALPCFALSPHAHARAPLALSPSLDVRRTAHRGCLSLADTAWLDGILAAKSVGVTVEPMSAVINAAVYRAYKNVQDQIEAFKMNLEKGQLSSAPSPRDTGG